MKARVVGKPLLGKEQLVNSERQGKESGKCPRNQDGGGGESFDVRGEL